MQNSFSVNFGSCKFYDDDDSFIDEIYDDVYYEIQACKKSYLERSSKPGYEENQFGQFCSKLAEAYQESLGDIDTEFKLEPFSISDMETSFKNHSLNVINEYTKKEREFQRDTKPHPPGFVSFEQFKNKRNSQIDLEVEYDTDEDWTSFRRFSRSFNVAKPTSNVADLLQPTPVRESFDNSQISSAPPTSAADVFPAIEKKPFTSDDALQIVRDNRKMVIDGLISLKSEVQSRTDRLINLMRDANSDPGIENPTVYSIKMALHGESKEYQTKSLLAYKQVAIRLKEFSNPAEEFSYDTGSLKKILHYDKSVRSLDTDVRFMFAESKLLRNQLLVFSGMFRKWEDFYEKGLFDEFYLKSDVSFSDLKGIVILFDSIAIMRKCFEMNQNKNVIQKYVIIDHDDVYLTVDHETVFHYPFDSIFSSYYWYEIISRVFHSLIILE